MLHWASIFLAIQITGFPLFVGILLKVGSAASSQSTLVFHLVSTVAYLFPLLLRLSRQGRIKRCVLWSVELIVFFAFYAIVITALNYPDNTETNTRIGWLVLMAVAPFLGGLLWSQDAKDAETSFFLGAIFSIGSITMLLIIIEIITLNYSPRSFIFVNPLNNAYTLGFVFLVAIYELKNTRVVIRRIWATAYLLTSIPVIVFFSERGPILAMIVSSASMVKSYRSKTKLIGLMALALGITLGVFAVINLDVSRMTQVWNPSTYVRLDILLDFITSVSKWALWGTGLGGYFHETGGLYPHNFLVEIGYELGLPGLLTVTMLFILIFKFRPQRPGARHSEFHALANAWLIFSVIFALLSFSVFANPIFWFALGITIGLRSRSGLKSLGVTK